MSNDTITAVDVRETEFGEKVALQSPYEAKEFINVLPWRELSEEVEEHGSLRAKAEDRGVDDAAIKAAEVFGFSDDFVAHASWEPEAFGPEDGGWLVDTDSWGETKAFFEHAGFTVEDYTDL